MKKEREKRRRKKWAKGGVRIVKIETIARLWSGGYERKLLPQNKERKKERDSKKTLACQFEGESFAHYNGSRKSYKPYRKKKKIASA